MKKGLTGYQIKLAMAALMVLDHLPHIPGLFPPELTAVFHALTRCVSAWFAFAAVEGFVHTRSRVRYNLRLFFWAAVMALGNGLIGWLGRDKGIYVSNNIFLTLAAGVLLLNLLTAAWPAAVRWLLAVPLLLAGMLLTEGGVVVLPVMLICWFLGSRPRLRDLALLLLGGLLLTQALPSLWMYGSIKDGIDMFLFNSDWLFITVIPLLHCYNGQRGRSDGFARYFFYVFYPAHLWLIAAIHYLIA